MRISLILFLLLMIIGFIVLHENAHATIYEYYGCNNISISYIPSDTLAHTKAICNVNNDLLSSQSNVDAIGYQIFPIILFLAIIVYKIFDLDD